MQPYRTSTKLKLGLIAAAVIIGVASLLFTRRLADQLQAQDASAVELWTRAVEYQSRASRGNPYPSAWSELDSLVQTAGETEVRRESLRTALDWAAMQPTGDALTFVFTEIVEPSRFSVPAIITDSARTEVIGRRNVDVAEGRDLSETETERLLEQTMEMDALNEPIRFEIAPGVVQYVHYGESDLARLVRWFPLVQLFVVALFVGVGYLGFSYVRRSEQSMLWVGMAREAAHQLGTPLSSMMGWIELLRLSEEEGRPASREVAGELEQDVERLRRVADRFEKIGTRPELTPTRLAPVLETVAGYIRRRIPRSGPPVSLSVEVPPDLTAQLNRELFEWVVENLLKNALDALDQGGAITVSARREGEAAVVEVADTGKGMDRATTRHVFRPGFSTKRRGWGLGLSLARRIVEAYHGGSLDVARSKPGEGTTFRIRLTAAEAAMPDGSRSGGYR